MYTKLQKNGQYWKVTLEQGELPAPKVLIYNQDRELEIERILSRVDFNYHKNLIVFGGKNIKLIQELLKRSSAYSLITVVEISEEDFLEVEYVNNIHSVLTDRRLKYLSGSVEEIKLYMQELLLDNAFIFSMKNLEIITLPYVKTTHPKALSEMTTFVFDVCVSIIHGLGNAPHDILLGTDNYFDSWSEFISGLDAGLFKGRYEGVPAVIVGAGPSLDKNLDQLKKIKGKALIFVVDAALETLRKSGVEPDAVASIERVPIVEKFYRNSNDEKQLIFLGPNVVVKDILKRFQNKIFTGRSGDGFFRDINEFLGCSNLDVGMNVASVLFAFANHAGCNPITLVGMDLAYTGGQTHSEDISENLKSNFSEIYHEYFDEMRTVESVDGEILDTVSLFYNTKVWFEKAVMSTVGKTVINATEGGAAIEGLENLKLTEFIEQYLEGARPVKSLYQTYQEINEKEHRDMKALTRRALTYLDGKIEHIQEMKEVLSAALSGMEKKSGKVSQLMENRNRIDEVLFKDRGIRFIVQPVYMAHYREVHSYPIQLDRKHEDDLVEISAGYYNILSMLMETIDHSMKMYRDVLEYKLQAMEG